MENLRIAGEGEQHPARRYSVLILLLFLISVNCAPDQSLRRRIDETVDTLIDRKISCPGFPDDTCAIPSEFHALADRAFKSSTTDSLKHYVSILDYGDDALIARVHLIRAAKESIDLQTYIWANDESGRLIFLELLKAARRGVKVRIIVDQITVAEDPDLLARLAVAHVNLEIGFYNPTVYRGQTTPLTVATGTLFSFRRTNQRMHNKVFVVDGKIGILGGRNIENKYFDFNPVYTFKDRDVIIMGPAVKQMNESFNRYWNDKIVVKLAYLIDVGAEVLTINRSNQSTFMEEPDYSFFSDIEGKFDSYSLFTDRPSARPVSTGRIVFIADLPGKPSKAELQSHEDSTITMREVVGHARKSITIQTPYLVLSRTAIRNIGKIREQNPNLKLTISTNSLAATDLYMIYAMTFKQKRKIINDLQAALFEFKPFPADATQYIPRYERLVAARGEMENPGGQVPVMTGAHTGPRFGMHAKSIVIDNSIALIGSHNLTPRSVNINTEVVAIIWDDEIAKRLEENILIDTESQNSWVITRRQQVPFVSHFSNFVGTLSSMLPFFDIWPFHYTSSFELKEGMTAVSPDHPDFYDHYEDVGQFPGTDEPIKSIKTRLIKSFGGFIAPLL